MNDNKPKPKGAKKDAKEPRPIIHLGMMGDGTEEQNCRFPLRSDPGFPLRTDPA